MAEQEKLRRDVATLRESIRLDWLDLAELPLTPDQRRGICLEIIALSNELAELQQRLESLDGSSPEA